MITEDYCSFGLSKLLKEKGFDEPCCGIWHVNNKLFELHYEPLDYSELREERLLAPTHQMAMKWLREKHNLHIEVIYNPYYEEYKGCMYKTIGEYNYTEFYSTYEEAVEAALKYVLEKFDMIQPERAH